MSRSLCRLALTLWDFCITNDITPIVTHLPGSDNMIVDAVSSGALSTHELVVDDASLRQVFQWWGVPKIDVFAMVHNKKCNLFCSRGGMGPRSLGDGLLLNWEGRFLYMFPPLPLLPRVLAKLERERPRCILVTPWWPRRVWFPNLLYLSQQRFLHIRELPVLLEGAPAFSKHLKLTAWFLT